MSKAPFNVGDRVMVYGSAQVGDQINGMAAVIANFCDDPEWMNVNIAGQRPLITVHRKQCRRLVKKERKRVWIHANAASQNRVTDDGWSVFLEYPVCAAAGPWIEFIEVLHE